MRVPVLLSLLALFSLSPAAFANERSGAFAIRGGTAPSAAFGEASSVLLDRPDVLLWNPAALVRVVEPRLEIATHDIYGLGLARHAHAAFGWRATREELVTGPESPRVESRRGNGVAFGLSLDVTTVDIGEGGDENYTEASPTLGLAIPLLPATSIGGAVRVLAVSSSIDDVAGGGYALDLGVTTEWGHGVRAAVGVRNLLGSVSWKDGGAEGLRGELNAAVGARVHDRARVGVGLVDDLGNDGLDTVVLAADVVAHDTLTFALGWETRKNGSTREGRFTPAVSIHVDRLEFDYAFVPAGESPGDTHRMSISVGL